MNRKFVKGAESVRTTAREPLGEAPAATTVLGPSVAFVMSFEAGEVVATGLSGDELSRSGEAMSITPVALVWLNAPGARRERSTANTRLSWKVEVGSTIGCPVVWAPKVARRPSLVVFPSAISAENLPAS